MKPDRTTNKRIDKPHKLVRRAAHRAKADARRVVEHDSDIFAPRRKPRRDAKVAHDDD
jgi:hypothetical protein